MNISLNMSSIAAAELLREGTVDIGKSTICNLIKKTPIIDKESITMICIDDFALKKRVSYGTIMVDIITGRRLIALGK
jgi:hypothetical protein